MTSWTSNSWAMWAVNPTRYRQMYLPKELGGGSSGSVSGSTQLQNSTATPCAGPGKSSCKKILVMDPRKKLVSCNSHSLMIMLHGGYGPRVGDILKMQGLTWFICLVLVPSFCECPPTHSIPIQHKAPSYLHNILNQFECACFESCRSGKKLMHLSRRLGCEIIANRQAETAVRAFR